MKIIDGVKTSERLSNCGMNWYQARKRKPCNKKVKPKILFQKKLRATEALQVWF